MSTNAKITMQFSSIRTIPTGETKTSTSFGSNINFAAPKNISSNISFRSVLTFFYILRLR